MPTDDISIPITVTIIVMGGYIFGGALAFSHWEDWDFLSSVYFTWVLILQCSKYSLRIYNDLDNIDNNWIWRLQSWVQFSWRNELCAGFKVQTIVHHLRSIEIH